MHKVSKVKAIILPKNAHNQYYMDQLYCCTLNASLDCLIYCNASYSIQQYDCSIIMGAFGNIVYEKKNHSLIQRLQRDVMWLTVNIYRRFLSVTFRWCINKTAGILCIIIQPNNFSLMLN